MPALGVVPPHPPTKEDESTLTPLLSLMSVDVCVCVCVCVCVRLCIGVPEPYLSASVTKASRP